MADEAIVSDEQLQQEVTQRASDVDAFLKRKDKVHALQKSLENPPVSSKSQGIKVRVPVILSHKDVKLRLVLIFRLQESLV